MSSRGTILLAVGMLLLGVLLGGLTGGVTGFFMGQNSRMGLATSFRQNTLPSQMPGPLPQQQSPQQNQPGNTVPRNFPSAANVAGGARVEEIDKDSPAEKAGLQVGDVITAVGTTKLDANTALSDAIKTYKPGDKVDLSITRGSQTLKLTVELGAATDSATTARLGIRYTPLTPNGRFRFPNG
jgi:S1-C subfamily serine protease